MSYILTLDTWQIYYFLHKYFTNNSLTVFIRLNFLFLFFLKTFIYIINLFFQIVYQIQRLIDIYFFLDHLTYYIDFLYRS